MKINNAMVLTVITVLISLIMQLAFIHFASHYISKETYGNFVLLQTLIAGLSVLLLQMPSQAFDRFYNTEKHKIEFINLFRTYLIFINFLSLLFIIVYGLIMGKFSTQILTLIFILFAMINIYSLNQKIFLLNLERKIYMYLKTAEASAKFLIPIIFYYLYQNLESLILGMFIGYFFSLILLYINMKDIPFSIHLNFNKLKEYFIYSYPFIFMSLMTWGISFSDRYFIEYYMTTSDVAIYALLAMVAGMGQIIGQIYFMYAQPKLLKLHSENEELAYKTIKRYQLILVFVFVFLFLIVILTPKIVFTILLEKEIIFNSYYYNTFVILLISIFLNVLHIAHHLYLKLFKKANILIYIYLVALTCNLIGNFFIETYGIIAAAISTLVAYTLILFLQIIYVYKYKKEYAYV